MVKIKDKIINLCFRLSFFLLASQLVILAFFWRKFPPQVPLFYSRPWGEEQLVSPTKFLILPLISLLVIIANLAIASLMPIEEKLLSQLLLIFAAVFNFLILVTCLKISLLVI